MEDRKVGVYVCHCGTNISATVDVGRVAEIIGEIPEVAVARDYKYMCSDPGQALIKEDIEEFGLDRVVVASCSPRLHEPTFMEVVEEAGLNPYCFEMANIREQCSWVHDDVDEATEKAIKLIRGAVAKAVLLEPLERRGVDVTPAALVIGGGIAGIQAALDIAEEGFKTYLVERTPSIGGHMAQLDKTFPTLDCSACILTPKMVDVQRHPNIELLTYSEVAEIDGYIGNFKVRVRKKPRYVDEDECIGCGQCAEACRMKDRIPAEFDLDQGNRSAIYMPFPQAVPQIYTVDPENCIMIQQGKCGDHPLCVEVCPRSAIDFDQEEEEINLDVGAIVVATGFDTFDPGEKPEYGYDGENVITGLEFERIVNASGPTKGKIEINGKEPERVVFISCVGSRDEEVHEYCSRVCCMCTAKHAHLVREEIPDAEITVYYTDMRAFGKGYEQFYNRVQEEGVEYRRRDLDDEIEVIPDGEEAKVLAEGYEDMEADLVVLATAIEPREDAEEVARLVNINRSDDGFFMEAHPKLRPVDTPSAGIFLAGMCQGPKDIPDAVSQASGAASRATVPLFMGEVTLDPIIASIDDALCSGCKICVNVCPYNALEFDEDEGVVTINDVLCEGCGVCASSCPSGVITLQHFTDAQLASQLHAMIGGGRST